MECKHTKTMITEALAKGDPSVLDNTAHLHLRDCRRCQKDLDLMVRNGAALSLLNRSTLPTKLVDVLRRDIIARIKKLSDKLGPREWDPRGKKKRKSSSK